MNPDLNELAKAPIISLILVLLILLAPAIILLVKYVIDLHKRVKNNERMAALKEQEREKKDRAMQIKLEELKIQGEQAKDQTHGQLLRQALDLSTGAINATNELKQTIIDNRQQLASFMSASTKVIADHSAANIEATRERTQAAHAQTLALENLAKATGAFQPYLDQVAANNLTAYKREIAVQTQAIAQQSVSIESTRQSIMTQLEQIITQLKLSPSNELVLQRLSHIERQLETLLTELGASDASTSQEKTA